MAFETAVQVAFKDLLITSRSDKIEQCGMFQREFTSYCNLDAYTCKIYNLHIALFNTLNLMVITISCLVQDSIVIFFYLIQKLEMTFSLYDFKWSEMLTSYHIVQLSDNLALSEKMNSTLVNFSIIFMFKYKDESPKLTNLTDLSNEKLLSMQILKKNFELLFSYCDWFTMKVYNITEISA